MMIIIKTIICPFVSAAKMDLHDKESQDGEIVPVVIIGKKCTLQHHMSTCRKEAA